ncbi:MAG: DUF4368 domain-containing protein [Bacillota bacterium]
MNSREQKQADIEKWVKLIKKHKDIDALDRYTANELLDKVYIGHPQTVERLGPGGHLKGD